MEVPFLKNKKNQAGGGATIEVERTPDSTSQEALAHGIADELLSAIDRKDFKGIRESLKALLHMIKETE